MAEIQDGSLRPVPALISLAFARVTADTVRRLNEAGFEDLRLTHLLQVVRHMSGTGDRPTQLARLAGVTPRP